MILKQLTMTNFMPYVADTTVSFEGSKNSNVTIFYGMNGHGKSSILHAIRWCLYNETRVNKKTKGVELLLNKESKRNSELTGQPVKMLVTLTWSTNGKEFELTRVATYQPKSGSFDVHATMRVDKDTLIPEQAIPSKVREFLPVEISHLFLFDGESQKEFDEMAESAASAAFIKAEIENTLSIPFIKKAISLVKERSNTESQTVKKIEKEEKKASDLRIALNQSIKTKDELDSAYDEVKLKHETATSDLNSIEDALGDVEAFQAKQTEIEIKTQELKSKKEEVKLTTELLRDSLKSNLWLPASTRLSEIALAAQNSARKQSTVSDEIGKRKASIQLLEDSKLSTTCNFCGSHKDIDTDSVDKKIDALKAEIIDFEKASSTSHERILLNLSQIGFNSNQVGNFRKHYGVLQQLQAKVAELNTDLIDLNQSKSELSTGASNTDALLASHTDLSKKLAFYLGQLNDLQQKRSAEDARQVSLKNELLKVGTLSPEKRRMLQALSVLESVLTSSLAEYTDAARSSVESKASETSRMLNNDPKWLGIKITEAFGAEAIDEYGAAQLTNTATKKIVAISLVDGLIRTAMTDGFILMDSPTGSLDQQNRVNFAKWAGNSNIQVSIFVHDGEFNLAENRKYFGSSIGRIYSIEQITNNESEIKETA